MLTKGLVEIANLERSQIPPGGHEQELHMDTYLDIQLAKLAVKTGLITKEQLKDCLIEQELKKKRGVATQLSDIILEKEYATVPQLTKLTKSLETEMEQSQDPQVSTAVENRPSPNPSTATQAGTKQIIEGYEIIEKLGSGAMGVVYKARQVNMDRLVALKVLPPKLAKNEQYRDRFLREARAAAKLNHENVVRAYDIGQSHGLYYFAMEFIDGRSVQDIMKDNGPFDEQTALDIVKQIAQGLAQAQKLNIVHRDIKPDNIMITSTKTAKLCDLGLAKQIDVDPQLTAHGAAVGTPWYISPEQAKGIRKIDTRADLYSLGATLFHMVCGGPPIHRADRRRHNDQAHQRADPRSAETQAPPERQLRLHHQEDDGQGCRRPLPDPGRPHRRHSEIPGWRSRRPAPVRRACF